MLPTPSPMVKTTCRTFIHQQARILTFIWVPFGGVALLLWLTGADQALAHALFHPTGNAFTKAMRHYGTWPAGILALASLVALFWPKLWQKRPTLYQTAAVMVLTAVLGCGLFNQIIVKNIADRPRPHEVLLAEVRGHAPKNLADGFRGNSMPSGHAAMGFVLAAPFFPLRRRLPRTAKAFLALGVTAGCVIGLSRMMLGAHFATDVLVSGGIALSAASLFTALTNRFRRISHIGLAIGTLVCALAVILGNRFSKMELTLEIPQPFKTINLPCEVVAQATPDTSVTTLQVTLQGYGAPLSNLKLQNKNDIISIRTNRGLYHSLACTAVLALPAE